MTGDRAAPGGPGRAPPGRRGSRRSSRPAFLRYFSATRLAAAAPYPGTRTTRSAWRRLRVRVASATRSSRASTMSCSSRLASGSLTGGSSGFPLGHPGDREGVARIALAGPSRPQPFPVRQLGRHLDRGSSRRRAGVGPRRHRTRPSPRGRSARSPPSSVSQVSRLSKPAGSFGNVASPSDLPTSSMAHAASVALWVSMPTTRIVSTPFPLQVRWARARRANVR